MGGHPIIQHIPLPRLVKKKLDAEKNKIKFHFNHYVIQADQIGPEPKKKAWAMPKTGGKAAHHPQLPKCHPLHRKSDILGQCHHPKDEDDLTNFMLRDNVLLPLQYISVVTSDESRFFLNGAQLRTSQGVPPVTGGGGGSAVSPRKKKRQNA